MSRCLYRAFRIGLAQILAETQASVGFDEYGYGMRGTDGAVVHCGRAKAYACAFGPGAVIGVLLRLCVSNEPQLSEELCHSIEASFPPLKLGQYHVRQQILRDGAIEFLVNGHAFGAAFTHIYHGKYYPAVSLFNGGSATLNLGPDFLFPPQKGEFTPVCALSADPAELHQ